MEDSTQSMTAVPLDEKHLDKSAFWGRLQPLTGLEPILMRDGADRYILNTDANPNAITEYFDTPKHGLSFYRKDGLVHLFNHDHYETSVNSSFIKIGHECILQHGDEIGTRKDHDSPLFRYIFQLDDLLAGAFERQILMSPENGTYVLETELGRGAFSTVRLGVHKESGKKYAVKLLHAEIPYGSAGEESLGAEGAKSADLARVASDVFAREIELMGQVCHDNIVQLYEHFSEASQAVMVLEYMGGGDLHDYVALQGHLSESVARDYFAQMVGAIEHLHGKMIVHRDLKPENFLLDMRRKRVKLSDFGVAKIVGNSSSNTIYGTPYYLAPEVLESNPALPHKYNNDDFAVDMYSLGAILFFMLTGDVPSLTNIHLHCDPASRDDHSAVPSKTSISSSACHTILELTRPNPRLRMSLALLLVDPWLSDEAFALPHTRPAWGSLSRQNPVERIPLIKNGLVLGRSKTADITICDPRVSGVHCQIVRDKEGIRLEDSSSNGIRVNGILIGKGRSAKIRSGDELCLVLETSGPAITYILETTTVKEKFRAFDEEERPLAKRARLNAADPRLISLESGQIVPLRASIRVGRRPDCDILLSNAAISSLHCIISNIDGKIFVEDYSFNGTWRNGQRLQRRIPTQLLDQDTIHLMKPRANGISVGFRLSV